MSFGILIQVISGMMDGNFCGNKKIMNEIAPKRFVGLHSHSHFSIGDSIGSVEDNIDFVLSNEMTAYGLTDHGNMSGFVSGYLKNKELKKNGINFKFIGGIEFYLTPDIVEWKREYEKQKEEKKEKKNSDDESSLENEEESKQSKFFNPIKRRHHLVALPKTQKGLENLFTLVSKSFRGDNFYRFPRISYSDLKLHGEDLVILSACLAGPLNYDVLSEIGTEQTWKEDFRLKNSLIMSKMKNTCDRIIDAVGEENFFPEIQANSLWQQEVCNTAIFQLCKETGLKPIATADSHYCRPDWWLDREIYRKLCRLNYEKFDPSLLPKSVEETKCELYPKNANQMYESFQKYYKDSNFDLQVISDAIERSHDVAFDLIADPSPDTSIKLPSFVVPEGTTAFRELMKLCKAGMIKRGLEGKKEYVDRLKYELEVIKEKDFSKYFLTMVKIVEVAKKHMLVSHGRGSSAGSLVCYSLGITNVDPIKYDLLFERFLSRSRATMPDVDFDCADRDVLVQLLKKEFGEDNVICITNFNSFKLKSLLKDLSRFYSVPFEEVNEVLKVSDKQTKDSVHKKGDDASGWQLTYELAMEHSEIFRNFIEKYPQLSANLEILLKQNRNLGKHAGGILISENIQSKMPVISVKGESQSPWAEGQFVQHLSPLGFVKFDVLSIETLKIVERTIELILTDKGIKNPTFEQINDWYNNDLDPDKLDLDDQNVYENVYHSSNPPAGIFQLSNDSCHGFFRKAKPRNIIDIGTCTSLFRPGPLSVSAEIAYVNSRNNPDEIKYEHPFFEVFFSIESIIIQTI